MDPSSVHRTMTHSDPSSPSDHDINALFAEEFDQDDQTVMDEAAAVSDEDRLYTDEFTRQNEMASRFLLLSVIISGVISVGLGCWFFYAQSRSQPSQNAPLQVPTQPPVSPFPTLNPNNSNSFSPEPLAPRQTQPPSDSGILPNTIPNAKPMLPNPTSPNAPGSAVTPPPPPEPPSSTDSP